MLEDLTLTLTMSIFYTVIVSLSRGENLHSFKPKMFEKNLRGKGNV